MGTRLQNARDQHQFEAANVLRDAALVHGKFGRFAGCVGEGAPVMTASDEIFTGRQRAVEVIGEEVDGQRCPCCISRHGQLSDP